LGVIGSRRGTPGGTWAREIRKEDVDVGHRRCSSSALRGDRKVCVSKTRNPSGRERSPISERPKGREVEQRSGQTHEAKARKRRRREA